MLRDDDDDDDDNNNNNSIICTMKSNYRIAATLYSLGTWFVSGVSVQIPCIKVVVMMMTMTVM
jgi:hypothetical protein